MKYSCYQASSVIHGWFVYWVFGWEMRRLSKSETRFRITWDQAQFERFSFSFRHARRNVIYEHSLCGKLIMHVCKIWELRKLWKAFEKLTELWKAFRYIFSPQIERKRSEEYLVINLPVEREPWAIFLPRVHIWKKQTPGSRLKT